jgi:hypothetical protein
MCKSREIIPGIELDFLKMPDYPGRFISNEAMFVVGRKTLFYLCDVIISCLCMQVCGEAEGPEAG